MKRYLHFGKHFHQHVRDVEEFTHGQNTFISMHAMQGCPFSGKHANEHERRSLVCTQWRDVCILANLSTSMKDVDRHVRNERMITFWRCEFVSLSVIKRCVWRERWSYVLYLACTYSLLRAERMSTNDRTAHAQFSLFNMYEHICMSMHECRSLKNKIRHMRVVSHIVWSSL